MQDFMKFAEDFLKDRQSDPIAYQVYPKSVHVVGDGLVYMADAGERDVIVSCGAASAGFVAASGSAASGSAASDSVTSGSAALGGNTTSGLSDAAKDAAGFGGGSAGGVTVSELTHESALALRNLLPFTAPSKVLSLDRSFGVGDRLGVAGPGHIRVFENCDASPVFAQQSMRELVLTNRSYADVVDTATFAVFRAGFDRGFGADGDHLKTATDIKTALEAGCTMITLDCSEHINLSHPVPPDAEMEKLYLKDTFRFEGHEIRFTAQELNDARAIYGGAIAFAREISCAFFADADSQAELEVSIDETSEATTPQQHFFIASELRRLGVDFVTLAPRFIGEFQKGVDYIGDLDAFERDFVIHAAIARHFDYKLSIHSGSDKFSVFPIVGKHTGGRFHLKTAGTSWLEAMRVVAQADPALYRQAHKLALDSFEEARRFYYVTTDLSKIAPLEQLTDMELPALLDQNDARQLIHITYGFILGDSDLNRRLFALWRQERRMYSDALYRHIGRHIQLMTGQPTG